MSPEFYLMSVLRWRHVRHHHRRHAGRHGHAGTAPRGRRPDPGARKGRSMTQAQLAERVGTSQSAINRIEQGGQNLSLEMLTRISDALDQQIVSIGGAPQRAHLRVQGGRKLSGSIAVNSSKNAAVALLCASLLNRGVTRLHKVARIVEVDRIIDVLRSLGATVTWSEDGETLEIVAPADLKLDAIDADAARRTRSVLCSSAR